MLKIYTKLDDVPEELRPHYKLVDGRYQPDLSDDHPVLIHNKKLLSEKSADTALVKELEADVEAAKSTSLPRGHVAIPKADAQLIEDARALGPIADVKVKLAEHETLKAESVKRQREDNLRLVAKELGYDNVEAFVRLPGLPEFEVREKDGKKTVVAKVKEGENVVERPAIEFMESNADIAPFLGALKTKNEGTAVSTAGAGSGGNQNNDPFKSSREFGKQWNESRPSTDVKAAFGITN